MNAVFSRHEERAVCAHCEPAAITRAAPIAANVCELAQPSEAAWGIQEADERKPCDPISAYFQRRSSSAAELSASTPAKGKRRRMAR